MCKSQNKPEQSLTDTNQPKTHLVKAPPLEVGQVWGEPCDCGLHLVASLSWGPTESAVLAFALWGGGGGVELAGHSGCQAEFGNISCLG